MPYGYYQFIRFAGLIGFVVLAYLANIDKLYIQVIIYGSLAILFQPFYKIALGREMWSILDIIIGIALLASLIMGKIKNQR